MIKFCKKCNQEYDLMDDVEFRIHLHNKLVANDSPIQSTLDKYV